MSKNKEVEIFGKKYIIRYKSIAWWIMMIGEAIYWLIVCGFTIFNIWMLITILLLVLE